MVSCLAQMALWHALLTAVKTSTLKKACVEVTCSKERSPGFLSDFNVEEEETSDSCRLFFPPALLPDAHTHFFSDVLFSNGISFVASTFLSVTICGYSLGIMGDSVFLDRQNSYLVSTRFIGHKLIIVTQTFTDKTGWLTSSVVQESRRVHVPVCACACDRNTERFIFCMRMT